LNEARDSFVMDRREVKTVRHEIQIMVWTPPSRNGIEVPKWKCIQSTEKERSVRNEDYDNWDRFGKGGVSGARRG
jgi:hypothetical protein